MQVKSWRTERNSCMLFYNLEFEQVIAKNKKKMCYTNANKFSQ